MSPSTETEWRAVLDWEGLYEVSSEGQVRVLARLIEYEGRWGVTLKRNPGRIIAPVVRPDGYLKVNLTAQGRKKTELVHRLVALAFLGPPDEKGKEVCHNNGNRADNRLSNLRWDTRTANHRDKKAHGTALVGSRNHMAKLSESEVREILESAEPQKKLAQKYGVSQPLISLIKSGLIWSHVEVAHE